MPYRADNEPEYIDDDDYHDPEDFGAAGRPGSNVLGGSGSRSDNDSESAPEQPGERSASAREPAFEPEPRGRAKRSSSPGKRSKMKARNPAPSIASSEERRARLAGKRLAPKDRSPSRRERQEPPQPQEAESRPLGKLRARFGRGDKDPSAESEQESSRLSGIAAGIKASLRGRFAALRDGGSPAANDASASRRDKGASLPLSDRASQPRSSKAPRIESDNWLDLDRKLDLLGVALVFGAIILFFSALSAEQAAISGLNTIIGQLLGWGALAVPAAMFAIGLWLIIRHFGDQAPTIDPVRLSGLVLAFLGVLIFFQYAESFNYAEAIARFDSCRNPTNPACVDALVQGSYQAGRGGGLVGGWLYSALVNNLTEVGGFIVVLMVMTFGAMMITRSSMAEMAVAAIGIGRGLRSSMSQHAAKRRAARLSAQGHLALQESKTHVRVAKPAPEQLTGRGGDARALPEPSAENRPIPVRIREFLGWRGKANADLNAEPAPLMAEAVGQHSAKLPGVFARLFGRSADAAPDLPQPPAPSAGRLERFLNLGDDLPFSATKPPAWQKPERPTSAQPPPAPSFDPASGRAPAMPDPFPPEPPSTPPAPPSIETNGSSEDRSLKTLEEAPTNIDPPAPTDEPAELAIEPSPEESAKNEMAEADPPGAEPAAPTSSEPEAPVKRSLSAPRPRIDWRLPEYRELLNSGTEGELDREPLMRQAQIIEDTLASFGAPGRIVEINSGPVITQYGVEPAYLTSRAGKQNRVKVGAIAKLDKDLQLALGAKSIRVEAPVPGKGYVGIEVPNPDSARVSLRDVMESQSYQQIESPLAIALGVSVDGTPISGDLTQMPHLLIAGTTGSGKSVCVNAIINSIIAVNSPDAVKFIMVDPKRVELTGYNGVPHLVAPVVVELERTIGVLRWVTTEMDARYKKFSQAGARNIVDFNSILDPDLAPMPYIVVVIDELADLMMMAPDDTERAITRIAALARATGIHLVIATQRPSVDVVTGLIKANCPARIAFAVAGSVDSRVILDQPGAERLLGKGDMLYLSGNSPAPLRMQGVHVSNEEINRLIRYWKLQGAGIEGIDPIPLPALPPSQASDSNMSNGGDSGQNQDAGQAAFWDMTPASTSAEPEEDELYQTAVDMVRRLEKASISLLQRRLRIGYTRAARLMDMMEERGVVGPPKEGSSKPRDVLPE